MKKLNVTVFDFQVNEILTRSQLKNILGGDPPASSGGSCNHGMTCGVYANGITYYGSYNPPAGGSVCQGGSGGSH